MSLQRIFELVKRQGLPLVMADGQGRDPVIVLPLDVYEALVEASGVSAPEASTDPTPDLLAELSTEERFYIDSLEEGKIS